MLIWAFLHPSLALQGGGWVGWMKSQIGIQGLLVKLKLGCSFKSDNAVQWLVCKLYRFGKLARGNNRSNVAHLNRARYLKQR